MAVEITEEFVWQNIPRRPRDSHKGTFGSVLAVAGSAFYRGAALLAAEGALRTGAGIVTLASVEPVVSAAAARLPECCLCPCSIEQYHNIHVVYTKEAETADMFIERVTHEIGRNRRVRVATSDGMEQIIILGHGALRVSARMFHEEVQNVEKQIRALVQGEA